MSEEPENLVLQLLRGIRADIARLDTKIDDTKVELKAEIGSEINSLRADVASDLLVMRKESNEQISGLRRAVIEYHSSVVGHGILISELEARLRRVEQHLDLPAMGTH